MNSRRRIRARGAAGARLLVATALGALALSLGVTAAVAQPDGRGPWPTSTEEQQGVTGGTFDEMVAIIEGDPRFARAKALLLVRHGTLIGERYFGGTGPDDLHDLRSVTKSVLSMTVGTAVRRGDIPSVNARVVDLLPDYAELLRGRPQEALDLEHLLTMQAGLEWHDDRQPWLDQIFVSPDLVQYLFEQRTVAAPGSQFAYSTAISQVLAKILTETTASSLPELVRQRLFAPLGIDRFDWLRRPSGDHYGGLGMAIEPRSMIRLGQLALQRGFWTDRQVVDGAWMNHSIRDARGGPYGYGYHWWRLGPKRFTAIGYGGQYLDIDRGMDTVLALVSEWNVAADQQIPLSAFDVLRNVLTGGLQVEAGSTVSFVEAAGGLETHVAEPPDGSSTTLRIAVERTGGDGALAVRIDTRRGSARSGRDFAALSQTLRWQSGDEGLREVEIKILGDDLEEGDESFFVDLERLTGNGTVSTPSFEVHLQEGRQEPPFEWITDTVTLREGEPTTATLRRAETGASRNVQLGLIPVSAEATDLGWDAPRLDIVFPAGAAQIAVTLEAVADDLAEGIEFALLTTPSDSAEVPPLQLVLLDADSNCLPGDADCLLDGRYRVAAHWRDEASGTGGPATFSAIPGVPSTPGADSVQASFFSTDNVEILLKMVDGTPINGSAWTYVAKSSDLPVWITSLDQATGRSAVWSTEQGRLCGIADTQAFRPSTAGPPGVRDQSTSTQSFLADRTGLAPASRRDRNVQRDEATCPDDALCLYDRFEVRVRFSVAGTDDTAQPIRSGGPSGAFWFFSPSNVEVAVKILDGRAINGHYWFYSGALTDLPYLIEVLDRTTETTTTFSNDRGDLCGFAEIDTL